MRCITVQELEGKKRKHRYSEIRFEKGFGSSRKNFFANPPKKRFTRNIENFFVL